MNKAEQDNKTVADIRTSAEQTNTHEDFKTGYGYAKASTPIRTAYSSSVLAAKPDDKEDIASYAAMDESKRPTAVMVDTNSDLSLSTYTGNQLGSVEEFLPSLNNKLIPVFRTQNADTAEALAAKLREISFPDAYILSSQEGLLRAKEANYNFYGILDLSEDSGEITADKLAKIRVSVNASNAKSVLLPEAYAEKEYVQALQKSVVSVWLDSNAPAKADACRLLACGANGYAVNILAGLTSAMEYFSDDAMLRKTVVIGHRGIPALAPENTLEGAIKAYKNGSDIVEVDIYVTTDDQLVILHDGELARTTTGTDYIEKYSLAELKEFYANKQFPDEPEYAQCRIPTMQEFFEEFKDTNLGFFIEIKSQKENCLPLLKALIDEYADYDMPNRCTIISFFMNQLKNTRKTMPGISASLLCGGLITDDTIYTALSGLTDLLLPNNTTFSTNYSGVGAASVEALALRGITTWPWTFEGIDDYCYFFKTNAGGLTTNYCHLSRDFRHTLATPLKNITIGLNQTQTVEGSVITYARETLPLPQHSEIVIIEGKDIISADSLSIIGLREGTASFMIKASYAPHDGFGYTLYSQPITVCVK